jgi:hypothetical protein
MRNGEEARGGMLETDALVADPLDAAPSGIGASEAEAAPGEPTVGVADGVSLGAVIGGAGPSYRNPTPLS